MTPARWCAAAALGLSACYNDRYIVDQALWDPAFPVALEDGLVVRLPATEGAMVLRPGAEPERIDLGNAQTKSVLPSPDGRTLLVRTYGVRCDPEWGAIFVQDCPDEARTEERSTHVVFPEAQANAFDTGDWYGEFTYSPDARFAVAPVLPDADISGGGVVSLDAVLVLDLERGKRWEVPVGFRATKLVFTADASGASDGMVVLSQSEVTTVDLSQDVPLPGTIFPLTLDPRTVLQPKDVVITPDDAFALIAVQGSADLYVLDLVNPSINLVGLSGPPQVMKVDAARDQTILTYARTHIDVLDHGSFETRRVALGDAVDKVQVLGEHALLWSSTGGRDAVRLNLTTLGIDTVRLNWAPDRLEVSPDGQFAVTLSSEAGGRLEVIDLRPDADDRLSTRSRPFGLDGRGLDLAFTSAGDALKLLLVQEGVDGLFSLSLPSYEVALVELEAPPLRLGAFADGTFWITHMDPLGWVSFLGSSGEVTTQQDFATVGMYDRPRLLVDGEVTP